MSAADRPGDPDLVGDLQHPPQLSSGRCSDLGSEGKSLRVMDDQIGQSTIVNDVVRSTLMAIGREVSGILHRSNPGPFAWYEFARRSFELEGMDTRLLTPCTADELSGPARGPANSVLRQERPSSDDPLSLPPIDVSLPSLIVDFTRNPCPHGGATSARSMNIGQAG